MLAPRTIKNKSFNKPIRLLLCIHYILDIANISQGFFTVTETFDNPY